MPPIRSEKSKRLIEQEGRIILAIAAYKNGQIPSINRAATLFNVPCQTLQYRIKGRAARVDICAG
jgi:predicted HTH domain antitoxin